MGISIERELNDLERAITTLRVDYERFFGGELRRPPVPARRAIEENLRKYGNAEVDKAAERFRLQALQSRFNAFAELWEKRMQAREEGHTGPIRRMAAAAPAAASGAAAAPPKTKKAAGTAPAPDVAALLAAAEAAVAPKSPPPSAAPRPDAPAGTSVKPKSRVDFTPLFQRYVAARQALGEDVSKLKYEKFEEAVRRQAEEIRKRTGSSRLSFEVQTTDGRVRLVGRPAPGPKG
ncbi:MAG: MXAN_5187 C-terminal domain-containing protein [Thermoanaerobaculia bacterium]